MDLKNLVNYCIVDTETTGLSPIENRIIEYGAVRVRNDEIVDTCHVYVQQNVVIEYFITNINGIDNALLDREGVDPKIACQKVIDFLGDDITMGVNNIPFDFPMIECECNRTGVSRPKISNFFDLGIAHKGIQLGNLWNKKEEFYRYALRIKDIRARGVKYNVDHLIKTYEVENLREDGVHGAMVDTKMLKPVWEKMRAQYFQD